MFIRKIVAGVPNTHSIDLEESSSQYLSITDAAQTGLDITGDMTIEAWIKAETFPAANGTILSKYNSAARSYTFVVEDTGGGTRRLRFTISDDGAGTGETTATATTNIAGDTGAWHHVAVAYDASAGQAFFYYDGTADGSPTGLKTAIFDGVAPVRIGARDVGGSPAQFFDGLIDEVRVWNDIRTSGEISGNRNKQLNGSEAGLVAYWRLNNDLTDETTNGNDLTNNNAAVFSADVPFS